MKKNIIWNESRDERKEESANYPPPYFVVMSISVHLIHQDTILMVSSEF